jgi:hypothetical protein
MHGFVFHSQIVGCYSLRIAEPCDGFSLAYGRLNLPGGAGAPLSNIRTRTLTQRLGGGSSSHSATARLSLWNQNIFFKIIEVSVRSSSIMFPSQVWLDLKNKCRPACLAEVRCCAAPFLRFFASGRPSPARARSESNRNATFRLFASHNPLMAAINVTYLWAPRIVDVDCDAKHRRLQLASTSAEQGSWQHPRDRSGPPQPSKPGFLGQAPSSQPEDVHFSPQYVRSYDNVYRWSQHTVLYYRIPVSAKTGK